jgi:excinuclease ABC subunit A
LNKNSIDVYGARENNLKNINLSIPKNKLVVITGISGSGKSSLAFATLYAEGQRRYIESLSSYARQFLGRVGKPDVDKIEGLTPAIAIDQKTTSKNPRSTVGTITEIYDYLRLLFARVGTQHCYKCDKPISSMSASDIISEVKKLPIDTKLMILAPLVKDKKGSFSDMLESLRHKGFIRAVIDGIMVRLDEDIELSKTKKHTIKVVIDRVVIKEDNTDRISSDVEKALLLSFGEVELEIINFDEMNIAHSHIHHSEHLACFDCKLSFEPLEPVSFSFNSHNGACKKCDGLGMVHDIDIKKIIKEEKSIKDGAVRVMHGYNRSYYKYLLSGFCTHSKIDMDIPYKNLKASQKKIILYGNNKEIEFQWKNHLLKRKWEGVLKYASDLFKDEKDLDEYMIEKICDDCDGHRLRPRSLSVKIEGKNISDIVDMPIEESYNFFNNEDSFSHLSHQQNAVAKSILKEIKERLFFLVDVGLGYITLSREARTISGGEAQRIRIASQIGSGLTGVMYVLDEPSIGLHERDTMKLIRTLKSLRDKGNSVIVVEHDKETIMSADYIIDIGAGAGEFGGDVVFAGTPDELKSSNTLTADYMYGKKQIKYDNNNPQKDWITIKNATVNNIKNLTAKIPLRNFVCVTGVSGSGKSSLILQTLLPTAKEILNHAKRVTKIDGVTITGLSKLDKVIYLDQSPIGRTPRSNPATYTGMMDEIRKVFAKTKEAELRGYKIGRFSFNVKGGRCENCQGDGEIKIEMHFLPDVMVQCDSCKGTRYNAQTLEITFKGKNIADVLAMSVSEAFEFFKAIPPIFSKLNTLKAVGLDYITLGQNAKTLSGGEAQRIKLAKELSKRDTGNTLYILDEPTTGLHFADVDRLTGVLHHLVELGNSVVVIEHNLDMIKNSDYIIDMGLEGGDKGGDIIAVGSPQTLVDNYKTTKSYTGKYLKEELLLLHILE